MDTSQADRAGEESWRGESTHPSTSDRPVAPLRWAAQHAVKACEVILCSDEAMNLPPVFWGSVYFQYGFTWSAVR